MLNLQFTIQISPVIAPHVREYVHHMLVYLCTLPLSSVGQAGSCFSFNEVTYDLLSCTLNGLLIAAWAVGGEVIIIITIIAIITMIIIDLYNSTLVACT